MHPAVERGTTTQEARDGGPLIQVEILYEQQTGLVHKTWGCEPGGLHRSRWCALRLLLFPGVGIPSLGQM